MSFRSQFSSGLMLREIQAGGSGRKVRVDEEGRREGEGGNPEPLIGTGISLCEH